MDAVSADCHRTPTAKHNIARTNAMPKKKASLIGLTFGRAKVTSHATNDKWGNPRSTLLCSCGTIFVSANGDLRKGDTKSCGCLQKEKRITHGMSGTATYRAWGNMIQRCTNPNLPNYHRYGGKGITVCEEWLNSFEAFHRDMGDCPEGLEIERVNNELGYFKENCVWGTYIEQARNKSTSRIVTFSGITACLAELCEFFNKNYHRVLHRLQKGWSVDRAFLEPCNNQKNPKDGWNGTDY